VGRQGWITTTPEAFTLGIRDSYRSGLELVLPTGPNELGWTMEVKP
jgi:hypothetical protein